MRTTSLKGRLPTAPMSSSNQPMTTLALRPATSPEQGHQHHAHQPQQSPPNCVWPENFDAKYAFQLGYTLDTLPDSPFTPLTYLDADRSVTCRNVENLSLQKEPGPDHDPDVNPSAEPARFFKLRCCYCSEAPKCGAGGMLMHLDRDHHFELSKAKAEARSLVLTACIDRELSLNDLRPHLNPPSGFFALTGAGFPWLVFRDQDATFVELGLCSMCSWNCRGDETLRDPKEKGEDHAIQICLRHAQSRHIDAMLAEANDVDITAFDAWWPFAARKFVVRVWSIKEIVECLLKPKERVKEVEDEDDEMAMMD
jgi:hypothetical protein